MKAGDRSVPRTTSYNNEVKRETGKFKISTFIEIDNGRKWTAQYFWSMRPPSSMKSTIMIDLSFMLARLSKFSFMFKKKKKKKKKNGNKTLHDAELSTSHWSSKAYLNWNFPHSTSKIQRTLAAAGCVPHNNLPVHVGPTSDSEKPSCTSAGEAMKNLSMQLANREFLLSGCEAEGASPFQGLEEGWDYQRCFLIVVLYFLCAFLSVESKKKKKRKEDKSCHMHIPTTRTKDFFETNETANRKQHVAGTAFLCGNARWRCQNFKNHSSVNVEIFRKLTRKWTRLRASLGKSWKTVSPPSEKVKHFRSPIAQIQSSDLSSFGWPWGELVVALVKIQAPLSPNINFFAALAPHLTSLSSQDFGVKKKTEKRAIQFRLLTNQSCMIFCQLHLNMLNASLKNTVIRYEQTVLRYASSRTELAICALY